MGFISVYCCTWNVGDEMPPTLNLDRLLGVETDPRPDIVFLGLQEVVRSDDWYEAIKTTMAPLDYVLIKRRNCWAIWIYAFVKRRLLPAINNIESELTALGYGGIMGNKGACSIRFEVCGVNMACVSAHFTPHMEKLEDRINDYRDILKDQTFRDPDVNLLMDHDYVFWMGDLNFRIEGLKKAEVERLVASKRYEVLLKYDQLSKVMKKELAFLDFKEGPIRFAPTFKFDKGTRKYDSSKKQRVPSWTDRILYMAHNDFALEVNVELDKMGRRIPQASRKHAVRGSPSISVKGASNAVGSGGASSPRSGSRGSGGNAGGSEASADDGGSCGECALVITPEIQLMEYNSISDYLTSDHRPVFSRFRVRVLPAWFELPVRFIQSDTATHAVEKDLTFVYVAMDPPPLTSEGLFDGFAPRPHPRLSGVKRVFRSAPKLLPPPPPSDLACEASKTAPSCSPEAPDMHPPAELRMRNSDWVALFPATFYDLWRDDVVSIFVSMACLAANDVVFEDMVEGTMERSDKLDIVKGRLPQLSFKKNYCMHKGKIEASHVLKCRANALQLVYFSKAKNCPQGYSNVVTLTRKNGA